MMIDAMAEGNTDSKLTYCIQFEIHYTMNAKGNTYRTLTDQNDIAKFRRYFNSHHLIARQQSGLKFNTGENKSWGKISLTAKLN